MGTLCDPYIKMVLLTVPSAIDIIVRLVRELDSISTKPSHVLLSLGTERRLLRLAVGSFSPLPSRNNRLALSKAIRDNEDGLLILRKAQPLELPSPNASSASEFLIRLPLALERHGIADTALGVSHDDADVLIAALCGEGEAIPGALEDKCHISGTGLCDRVDADGLEDVAVLDALGIDGPFPEEIDAVADADWAVGEDDYEGLVYGVRPPVHLSLVNKHLE